MRAQIAVHKKTGQKFLVTGREPGRVLLAERISQFSIIDGLVISVHTRGLKKYIPEILDIQEVELTGEIINKINGRE